MSQSSSAIRRIGLVCAVLCLLAVASVAQSAAPLAASDELPQSDYWYRVTPSVVWCNDPASTFTIEVHIVGRSDVAAVWVTNGGYSDLTLYDDGTHGDATAGDRVFTLSNVLPWCAPDYLEVVPNAVGYWGGFPRVRLNNGNELHNHYQMTAGTVHQKYKSSFGVRYFGKGLSATSFAFFINDAKHEVLDDYPLSSLVCGTTNFEAYRKLYSIMPDVFDMAVVMPGMQMLRTDGFGENTPYQVQVANAVQHIGLPVMDNTAQFGSAGRLQSTVYHSFGSLAIMDHEMGHMWAAGIGSSLGLIEEGLPGRYHWNALTDIGGQMGYYYIGPAGEVGTFAYNGDGTWHLVANTDVEPYAPLDLYVMGLIPPEQVPPIHILTAPNLSDRQRITAASVQTVTIQQIMAAEGGARVPSAAASPKAFNVAFIVTQDTPYTDAAYAYWSLLSQWLMTHDSPYPRTYFAPFYWATGGRATLNTVLPELYTATWVNKPLARPGDVLSYTTTLTNAGSTAHAGLSLTETVPLWTTYKPGSLWASSGSFAQAGSVVTWTGSAPAGGSVRITYAVTVQAGIPDHTAVIGTARISGAQGVLFVRDAPTIVNPRRLYLPAIMLNRAH